MEEIVLLGTGTANIDSERFGSATAVVVDDRAYLVDCGAGVLQRASAAQKLGVEALNPAKLTRLFLTHLHADHTTGYADLILGSWIMGRDEPLRVYGPRGTKAMTDHLLLAYEVDIRERINGIESLPADGYQVEVHEIDAGLVYDDDGITVEAFSVDHGKLEAFGYAFRLPGHRVVFSGDTTPVDAVVKHALNVDVLVHNVYSSHLIKQRSKESQQIHKELLTSGDQLADIAGRATPRRLILNHLESWEVGAQLITEVQRGYDGEIMVGKDGQIIKL